VRLVAVPLLLAACNSTPPNNALTNAEKTADTLSAFRVVLEAKDFGAIAQNYGEGPQTFVRATVAAHPWATGGAGLGATLDTDIQKYIGDGNGTDATVQEASEEGIYHIVLHASFEQVYAAAALDTVTGWDTAFGLYGDSGATPSGLGGLAIERDTEFGLANESSILAAFSTARQAVARGGSGADSLATIDSSINTVFGLSLRHEFAEAAANVAAGKPASALEGFAAGSELWRAQRDRFGASNTAAVTTIDGELTKGSVLDASTMSAVDFNKLVDTVTSLFALPL
jgi:hypothetical protein